MRTVKFYKKRETRRALSSIIATTILLTGTVIMGTGLVNWSNSKVTTFETAIAQTSSSNTNKVNENLSIENIVFCNKACPLLSGNQQVNVTMTNIGNIGLNIAQIQFANTNTWKLIPPISLMPHQSYTYQHSFNWVSKTPYSVTVTSARGSVFVIQAAPP